MLRLFLILGFLVGGCLAQAAPPKFDSLRVGSEVYSNVTVLGANATDLYFKSDQGISNVKLKYLSPELQRRFGYDPKEAAKAEQEKTKSDARYEGELAAQV
ncbi:MAG TPA: hypothetical protein VHH88_01130, partial [Verrucomicrobiae bacterium]|nr:hypothetical protein [Verrucomicrobiae bacterium]